MAPKKDATDPEVKFDSKWLKDLTHVHAKTVKVKGEDGKEKSERKVVERPLAEDDLLDWKVADGHAVLVTKAGRKHRVKIG